MLSVIYYADGIGGARPCRYRQEMTALLTSTNVRPAPAPTPAAAPDDV